MQNGWVLASLWAVEILNQMARRVATRAKPTQEGFKKILEKARAYDLEVKTDMAVGHPGEQIIHRAEVDGIDLIILGRRGRFMISRMMLGSVSERVLRYAHCPVMVVH